MEKKRELVDEDGKEIGYPVTKDEMDFYLDLDYESPLIVDDPNFGRRREDK
jgi:hypothetical protein